MKRKNVIASVAGIVLSVITVFTSVGAIKAKEGTVTDGQKIKVDIETEAEERQISEEYFEALKQWLGWDFGENKVSVQTSDTVSFTFDLEASGLTEKDLGWVMFGIIPPCYRNADGKLQFTQNRISDEVVISRAIWQDDRWANYIPSSPIYMNKKNTYILQSTEMYFLRVWLKDGSYEDHLFIPADYKEYQGDILQSELFGEDGERSSLGGYWKKEYGDVEFSNIHLAEKSDVDDNKPSDTYTLDLSSDNDVVSSEIFNTLLEENKTKDIVIKSDNDVTFTFTKGTMKPVEGKDSYDFSTTINSAYNTDLPSYVTSNNFVSQINYNYSGKLPAEASIRFYAGTQYSGKTLYYYLLNEDKTFAEVQSIVVDDLGYVTVKQDHCSNYLLTSEEPKNQDNTNNTETSGTTEDKTSPVTGDNASNKETPATGDNSMMLLYLLAGVSAMGMIVVSKKVKTVKNS